MKTGEARSVMGMRVNRSVLETSRDVLVMETEGHESLKKNGKNWSVMENGEDGWRLEELCQ